MKLLYCRRCKDIFGLRMKTRHCECEAISGKYLQDGINAIYSGNAIPLGIDNNSLRSNSSQPDNGSVYIKSFMIAKNCKTIKRVDEIQ